VTPHDFVHDKRIPLNAEAIRRLDRGEYGLTVPVSSRSLWKRDVSSSGCRSRKLLSSGRIGVNSTPGQGATFWFTLPDQEMSGGVSSA
jgi:hypothetical protein